MSCEQEHNENGHNHDDHILPIQTNTSQNLLSKINLDGVKALNLANPSDELPKLFRPLEEKFELKPVIKSDCDAQLIINIPFLNSSTKLFSLILRSNGDKYCPKTIKLFKNDEQIDFDNVESKKPIFTITHPRLGVMYNEDDNDLPDILEQEDEFVEHFLPRHKLTGVQHLTVFIQDIYEDEDEDECHLHYLELRGEATELTKDPVITLYELAANPADHKSFVKESTRFSMGN